MEWAANNRTHQAVYTLNGTRIVQPIESVFKAWMQVLSKIYCHLQLMNFTELYRESFLYLHPRVHTSFPYDGHIIFKFKSASKYEETYKITRNWMDRDDFAMLCQRIVVYWQMLRTHLNVLTLLIRVTHPNQIWTFKFSFMLRRKVKNKRLCSLATV